MLFNSFEFALFLPTVFLTYWFVIRNLKGQNLFLLLVSYLFYGWWDWRFLSLLIFSSTVDFFVGKKISETNDNSLRKKYLAISLMTNLGLLGFFKYYNFFIQEFISALNSVGVNFHTWTLEIILPVGISFYTFQTLSYTIDVYRKKIKPVDHWLTFFVYVSFFPQLVAGPIERAGNLIPQFQKSRAFSYVQARDGMQQILWGLFKKVVIADHCAKIVDASFIHYADLNTVALAIGLFLFAIQIYCDFSGYSSIAIGTAKLLGFKLMRNFAFPYFSRDIAEFWRRWHISLSTWFRDYLYIPLGGSRVRSRGRLIFNVAAIFLVSGFWHGANWTFLAWGALHAVYFIPGILLGRNRRYLDDISPGKLIPSFSVFLNICSTFFFVCIAWVFFRAESLTHALDYLQHLFFDLDLTLRPIRKHAVILFGALLLLGIEWIQRGKEHAFQFSDNSKNAWGRRAIYITTAMAIIILAPRTASVFIYFQF